MQVLSFVHVCCNRHQIAKNIRNKNVCDISYNVSAAFFASSNSVSSRPITSLSSHLHSAACSSNNRKDYGVSAWKCDDALAVKLPRILFFGGDIVSYSSLSALYYRMYNIALNMLQNNDCTKHQLEELQNFSVEPELLTTEKHKKRRVLEENGKSEPAFKHDVAQQIVQDHLIVICPSLPESYTNITEVVHKFRRQYPVLRFCAEKELAVFPVDHPKSFAKSMLYQQMRNQEGLARNKVTNLQINAENISSLDQIASHKHTQEWQNSKHWRLSSYDLAVIVSFRYYLPNLLLSLLPRVINVHPSLLPKYRGASPILSTLMHNEVHGGVSIIKLTPRQKLMDSGDVLLQQVVPIPPSMDVRSYFPLVTQTAATALCDVIFGKKEERRAEHLEEYGQELDCQTDNVHHKSNVQSCCDKFMKCEPNEVNKDLSKVCNVGNTSSINEMYCDWPRTFDKLWSSAKAQVNTDYAHYKDDPFHAPLLPKYTSAMQFKKQTALEVYGVWRAFVGYEYFAASANALFDKFATPVGAQLLLRIIQRKEKELSKRNNQREECSDCHQVLEESEEKEAQVRKQHERQKEEISSIVISECEYSNGGKESAEHKQFAEDTHSTLTTKPVTLRSALYKYGVAELCKTCSFVQAVHPSLVSQKVQEEMSTLSNTSSPLMVATIDYVKEHSNAFSCINSTSDNEGNIVRTSDDLESACNTVNERPCAAELASITPGTCYFPLADAELGAIKCAEGWFYWRVLHLKCASRPQKACLLRQGLAMKKGVLYRNVFRSIPIQPEPF